MNATYLPDCTKADPLWIQRFSLLPNIEDVQLMLVDGGWLDSSNMLQKLTSLKVAIQGKTLKKKKQRKIEPIMPEG